MDGGAGHSEWSAAEKSSGGRVVGLGTQYREGEDYF